MSDCELLEKYAAPSTTGLLVQLLIVFDGSASVNDVVRVTGWPRKAVLKYGKKLEQMGFVYADKAGNLPTLYTLKEEI